MQRLANAFHQWRQGPVHGAKAPSQPGGPGTSDGAAVVMSHGGHPVPSFHRATQLRTAGPADADNPLRASERSVLERFIGAPPKDDIRILGRVVWHRSTPYKAVQAALTTYHSALDAATTRESGYGERCPSLEAVQEARQKLEQALQNYLRGHFYLSHKPKMRELSDQLASESKAMAQVESIVQRREAKALSVRDLVGLVRSGVVLNKAALERLGPVVRDPFVAHAFAEHQFGPGSALFADGVADVTSSDEMTALGKGAFNTVFSGPLKLNGVTSTMVFKQEAVDPRKFPAVASFAEIDDVNPQWMVRSILTHRFDRELGLGLVPRTVPAVSYPAIGSAMDKVDGISPFMAGSVRVKLPPALADYLRGAPAAILANLAKEKGFHSARVEENTLVMVNDVDSKASKPADSISIIVDYGRATVRRELVKLQLLDFLTANLDRHGANMFFEFSTEGQVTGLKAIDSDIAFGKNIRDPRQGLEHEKEGGHGARLPRVVDSVTREAFLRMSKEDVVRIMGGLLSPEEVASTCERLDVIHQHLRGELPGTLSPLVLPPEDAASWESEGTSVLLGFREESEIDVIQTSYAAREWFYQQQDLQRHKPTFDPARTIAQLAVLARPAGAFLH